VSGWSGYASGQQKGAGASPCISRLSSLDDILANKAGILGWISQVLAQARTAPVPGPEIRTVTPPSALSRSHEVPIR